jgi:hypothetical protein
VHGSIVDHVSHAAYQAFYAGLHLALLIFAAFLLGAGLLALLGVVAERPSHRAGRR